MTDPTSGLAAVHVADVEAAGMLPCVLAPEATGVADPWVDELAVEVAADLAVLLRLLHASSRQVGALTTRTLPAADEPLVGGLTVRLWSLGVADTAGRLADALARRTAGTDPAGYAAVQRRLQERYAEDPGRFRRDGLDVLVGSLLTG